MQISLLSMGNTDEIEIKNLIYKYENRLPQHYNYNRIELPDIKNRKRLSESEQKRNEFLAFENKIKPSDYVILLDEKGKSMSSIEFSRFLNDIFISNIQHIIFVVGGPYGFAAEMHKRANAKLSFSKMTFTHQMIRLFFTEQLYRAFTILQGKSYHHE